MPVSDRDSARIGSVALSDCYQKMALILLNDFCLELLNATELPKLSIDTEAPSAFPKLIAQF